MSTRILIVDTIATHRIARSALLERIQYDVSTVATLEEAEDVCFAAPPDLVILGTLPVPPAEAASRLNLRQAASRQDAAPVICIGDIASAGERVATLESGVRDLLPRQAPEALLLASVRRILRETDTGRELERRRATASSFGFAEPKSDFIPARRIAVVGSGALLRDVSARLSTSLGYDVMPISAEDALRNGSEGRSIDAYVILSGDRPRADIRALLPELRARSHSRHSAVLVLHPEADLDSATAGLDGGATDVAPDTAEGAELAFRLSAMLRRKSREDALRQTAEDSYRLAATDELTGLYNRRYADAYLEQVMLQSQESQRDMTLMLIDIDHFKRVNDVYGHAVGDEILREVASRIRGNLRAIDLVSRHGGEEFLVVMPETDSKQAVPAAERLRAQIGDREFRLDDGRRIDVTASIGVSVWNPTKPASAVASLLMPRSKATLGTLMRRVMSDADGALYSAKAEGRNCVNFTLTAA